jgi:hypothetical protein
MRQLLHKLALFVCACASSAAALAQETSVPPAVLAAGATIGTLGVGGELSYRLTQSFVIRGSGSYLALDLNEAIGSVGGTPQNNNFKTKGIFAGGLIDWHPAGSGWRLTGGLRYADLKFDEISANGHALNGTNYTSAQVGAIKTSVVNKNSAAPYIGFGYDATHFGPSGFSLGLDVGALYIGAPDVKITTEKSVAGLASDIAGETSAVKNSINKYYNFYPVLMLTGKFSF